MTTTTPRPNPTKPPLRRGQTPTCLAGVPAALLLAYRNMWQHKFRTFTTMVLIAFPIFAAIAATTLTGLADVNDPDRARVGAADFVIVAPYDVEQVFVSDERFVPQPAVPLPGWAEAATTEARTTVLNRVFDGEFHPEGHETFQRAIGDQTHTLDALVTSGAKLLGNRGRLLSGQWPTNPDQVVVNQRLGIALGENLTLRGPHGSIKVTVVGKAALLFDSGRTADVLLLPATVPEANIKQWLGTRDHDLSLAETAQLDNARMAFYGSAVPPSRQLSSSYWSEDQAGLLGFLVLYSLLIGGVIACTSAPAFAINIAERTRELALVATVGARTAQVRKVALATCVVIAGPAVLAGSLAGILFTPLAQYASDYGWIMPFGNLHTPWGYVVLWTVVGAISALIAGLVPVRKIELAALRNTLQGAETPPPVSKIKPVVGVGLVIVGLLAVPIMTNEATGHGIALTVAVPSVILGLVFLMPLLLGWVARSADRLTFIPRVALRDMTRQAPLFVPAVCAAMATMLVLTASLIVGYTDDERSHAAFSPKNIAGSALLTPQVPAEKNTNQDGIRKVIATHQDVVAVELRGPQGADPATRPDASRLQKPLRDLVLHPNHDIGALPQKPSTGFTSGTFSTGRTFVLAAEKIVELFSLTGEQAQQVRDGAIVSPSNVGAQQLTLVSMPNHVAEGATIITRDVVVKLPAGAGGLAGQVTEGYPYLYVPEKSAQDVGWQLQHHGWLLRGTDGAISTAAQSALIAAGGGQYVFNETPTRSYDTTILWYIATVIALLVMLVSCCSTAILVQGQQHRQQGVWHAVGARPRARRWLAFGQGATPPIFGGFLGLLLGLALVLAVEYLDPRHSDRVDGVPGVDGFTAATMWTYLTVPWGLLLGVLLFCTVVSGLISALMCKRKPPLDRRID